MGKNKKPRALKRPSLGERLERANDARHGRQHARMKAEASGTVLLSNGEVGRNDPCPCGSAKKYKSCCLSSAATHFVLVDAKSGNPWAPEGKIILFASLQQALRCSSILPRAVSVAMMNQEQWIEFEAEIKAQDGSFQKFSDWRSGVENIMQRMDSSAIS